MHAAQTGTPTTVTHLQKMTTIRLLPATTTIGIEHISKSNVCSCANESRTIEVDKQHSNQTGELIDTKGVLLVVSCFLLLTSVILAICLISLYKKYRALKSKHIQFKMEFRGSSKRDKISVPKRVASNNDPTICTPEDPHVVYEEYTGCHERRHDSDYDTITEDASAQNLHEAVREGNCERGVKDNGTRASNCSVPNGYKNQEVLQRNGSADNTTEVVMMENEMYRSMSIDGPTAII